MNVARVSRGCCCAVGIAGGRVAWVVLCHWDCWWGGRVARVAPWEKKREETRRASKEKNGKKKREEREIIIRMRLLLCSFYVDLI